MSLRQVLTIYNAERQLTDDETALLNTLRKMTDAERGMFVDGLSDKPQKKSAKKSTTKPATKSTRAQSLQGAIKKTPKALDGGVSKMRCSQENCGEYADNPIHDLFMGYAGHHPFTPSAPVATAASKWSRQSSADGSGVSSETPLGEDGVAVSVGG